jgi:hypothetical protein
MLANPQCHTSMHGTVCAKTKQDFVAENPVTPGHTSPMAEDIFGTKNGFEYVVLG